MLEAMSEGSWRVSGVGFGRDDAEAGVSLTVLAVGFEEDIASLLCLEMTGALAAAMSR